MSEPLKLSFLKKKFQLIRFSGSLSRWRILRLLFRSLLATCCQIVSKVRIRIHEIRCFGRISGKIFLGKPEFSCWSKFYLNYPQLRWFIELCSGYLVSLSLVTVLAKQLQFWTFSTRSPCWVNCSLSFVFRAFVLLTFIGSLVLAAQFHTRYSISFAFPCSPSS